LKVRSKISGKAEYRSAIRSRKLIKQAFVELMREKGIDEISVKDIVTKADINRGTFYAHYTGTHAVIEQIENEIIATLLEFMNEFQYGQLIENPLPFLLKIASFLEQDLEFYRLFFSAQHSLTFINKMKTLFLDKMVSNEKTLATIKNKDQFLICANFFAYGFVGLYHDWFNHKIKMSLNDLSLIVSQTIKTGFRPFLLGRK
jgi:AcrR family transcriptional regulator